MINNQPDNQVFWYTSKDAASSKPLDRSLRTDVVIVGGGMAGLTAAQQFAQKGCQVVVLEKNFCGSGATGKSSGFITPDSELEFNYFLRRYGPQDARRIWEFAVNGGQLIQQTIEQFNIACDYQLQDTLIVANSAGAIDHIKRECDARATAGYNSTFYDKNSVSAVLGSTDYFAGIRYGGSFGIKAFDYVTQLKAVLEQQGIAVYQETPVATVVDNAVITEHGYRVDAQHVVVAADWHVPALGGLSTDVYHAQTVLMMSAPLSDAAIKKLFPEGRLMVWDTDLIYTYYRVTGDNRLLLGGATLWDTYKAAALCNPAANVKKLAKYWHKKFPDISAEFHYVWPGLIGISKDLMPIAGADGRKKGVYYITAAAGLPWAAGLGRAAADYLIDGTEGVLPFFDATRSYPLGSWANYLLGNRATFALSNFITLLPSLM